MTEFVTVSTNLFIVAWLLFMWGWDYPPDVPVQRIVRWLFRPLAYIGLWHGWAMFAPEPIAISRWIRAEIRRTDQSIEIWEPLRPESNQKLANSLFVRSFKYQHSILSGQYPVLYEPLCRFLVKQAAEESSEVLSVALYRDYRYVQPFGKPAVYSAEKTALFYRYSVPSNSPA